MEQKIVPSVAVNIELLRHLQAMGMLGTATLRDLVDLAKMGGFATVVVNHDQLANLLERLRQIDRWSG